MSLVTCGAGLGAGGRAAEDLDGRVERRLALTSGNTDTSNVNAAYDIVYNPQTKNVVKSDGLFLRGETEGVLSANRVGLNVRDEYSLTTRTFLFGQNQYLHDEFKNIDYLVAPTAGVGYKIFDTAKTKFAVDGSAGGVWEKNPGFEVDCVWRIGVRREAHADADRDHDADAGVCGSVENQELRRRAVYRGGRDCGGDVDAHAD